MKSEHFVELARELAQRGRAVAASLSEARSSAERLRALAERAVSAFRDAARAEGAEHLCHIAVSPVEPDHKHVDCVQFGVARGRWEILCVAKASGRITLVGPFKRGHAEKPCDDFPLRRPELERGLQERLIDLIRRASVE